MTKTIVTTGPEETESYARSLAARLRGGEVIELVSDLGGGKTTFTRGLVAGLNSPDVVTSPTFTISREYTGGRLHVYHFDFYRLGEAGITADELAEVISDDTAVVVVEWADVVQQVLPKERMTIRISPMSEIERKLEITYDERFSYLFDGKEAA